MWVIDELSLCRNAATVLTPDCWLQVCVSLLLECLAGRLGRWMPILRMVAMRLSDGRLHRADIRIGSEALVSVSDCYSLELPIITLTKMKGWQVGVSIS